MSRPPARAPLPPVPDGADESLLDPYVLRDVASLTPPAAKEVRERLVAVAALIDIDPVAALGHARAARQRGSRLAVVREAAGVAAYRAGEYAEARTDLQAARRMSGDASLLAVLADIERGLGRPQQALVVAADAAASTLDPATRAELALVVSGARCDLGQADAAVLALSPWVEDDTVRPWSVRVWYGYAEALVHAGRADEARSWFEAAASIDVDDTTDAAARAYQIEEVRSANDLRPLMDAPSPTRTDAPPAAAPDQPQWSG